MPRFRVVLVNPKTDGNVGAVARIMGNFGFKELWLVDPCEITDEARKRAKHANHILDEARVVDSLDEALDSVSMVVGTSGIVYPAAAIPFLGKQNGAKLVEVNLEPTPFSEVVDHSFLGKAGEVLPKLWEFISK